MKPSYQDLRVWQHSMDMVVKIYAATQNFPKQEVYGLTSQMRRAAVSIPSNIPKEKENRPIEIAIFSFATPEVLFSSSKHKF